MNEARGKQQRPSAGQFSCTPEAGQEVSSPRENQEAKGNEVSLVAGPRLEGVIIAEAWCHSQSLPACQDLQ